jgi:hypothetical protein
MYVIWNFGRELGVKASRFKLMDISFHLIEFWCSIRLLCCSLLAPFLQDQIMANFLQPFRFSTMPEYAFFKKDMKILVKVEWQLSDSFKVRQYCWRNSNISTCNFLPGTYKGDYKSALCYTDASAPEGTERGDRWWNNQTRFQFATGFTNLAGLIVLGFNRIPYIALSDEVQWTMLTFLSKKISRMKIIRLSETRISFRDMVLFNPGSVDPRVPSIGVPFSRWLQGKQLDTLVQLFLCDITVIFFAFFLIYLIYSLS